MRILFTLLRNVLLEMFYLKCNPKFFCTHTQISCEKLNRSFGLTLQVFYQFFKSRKSRITQ